MRPEHGGRIMDEALTLKQMARRTGQPEERLRQWRTLGLIGTEEGILHRLRQENPEKEFFLISDSLVCPDMKKTTLESVARAMEQKQSVVTVPEEIGTKAKRALDRMLAVS